MRKFLSILLTFSLLFQCLVGFAENEKIPVGQFPEVGFSGTGDPALLRYTEDVIYETLISELDSEQFFVENVSAIYISQEYLDELEYNSQENIYFGYKLSDIAECFQGTKYVFTLGDDGKTIITEFEEYDDTYDQVLKNVAIGTGVILICVVVSVVTYGAGASAISMVFAASAKTGAIMAVSNGAIGGISAGIVTGIQTGDMEQAVKAAALAGSEGYKWGAITGAVSGGISEAAVIHKFKGVELNGLTLSEAVKIQKESKYPVELIKQFHSVDEYLIYYRDANLRAKLINGCTALVPDDIDLKLISTLPNGRKVTNLERMMEGYAPIDAITGKAYQLHHIGQKTNGTLAVLTEAQHQGNASILNIAGKSSEIDRPAFEKVRDSFWRSFGKMCSGA